MTFLLLPGSENSQHGKAITAYPSFLTFARWLHILPTNWILFHASLQAVTGVVLPHARFQARVWSKTSSFVQNEWL
jgi:hypothetical protein